MKEYDVIVIGSGSGLSLTYRALSENMKTALVAKEYLGGTCFNVGCVPSKSLIYAADIVRFIEDAQKFGINATIQSIDFPAVMDKMRLRVATGTQSIGRDLKDEKNLDFYPEECRFIGDYTIKAGNEEIRGKNIFIASGARPAIPPIKGLSDLDYLTNESILGITALPKSMIIIGGSYIGVEYAHFFAAMGSDVSIVEYSDALVPFEEAEISDFLRKSLEKRMKIFTGHEAMEIAQDGDDVILTIQDRKTKEFSHVKGSRVLVAAGRQSNADRLDVDKTGVSLTKNGFIEVDNYLRTSKAGIMAIGDATGKGMFTHAADKEVEIAWHNAFKKEKVAMDFSAVPHAVYTDPQIASIGLTESQAAKDYTIAIGRASYRDTVQGDIRMADGGFAKAIIEKGTGRILGFHIIGPDAPILIQEVVNVFTQKGTYQSIVDAMHIFPSLSDLITEAFARIEE
ncbi:MAG: dihydrolipoyl dehydrogenase family protein [Syntrophorhabdaceae bacterium]